jgi:hypothetical protein
MVKRFWKWLALFAYRRWAVPAEKKPTGIPLNRDPECPCPAFEPRPRHYRDWGKCQGDGHYLCNECCHWIGAEQEDLIALNI